MKGVCFSRLAQEIVPDDLVFQLTESEFEDLKCRLKYGGDGTFFLTHSQCGIWIKGDKMKISYTCPSLFSSVAALRL